MRNLNHPFLPTSYPKVDKTQPLSFKRISETCEENRVSEIVEEVIESVLEFLDIDPLIDSLETSLELFGENDMFEFLSGQ